MTINPSERPGAECRFGWIRLRRRIVCCDARWPNSACEVDYWKSRHADALLTIPERDVLIEQQQAEIKQLKSRQFGRRSEKSSG